MNLHGKGVNHMTRELMPWSSSRDLDSFFEDFGLGRFSNRFFPAVDVYQDADNVIADISIAGIDPEKVNLTVEGDVLTVSGQTEEKKETRREDYYRKEIREGSFSRSVLLPMRVKGNEAEAHYEKGMLKVVMPKSEEAKSKKIAIRRRDSMSM